MDKHPVPEVRDHTFRRQDILPTPPGDAQPNPPDSEADIRIKVYKHREDEELPAIAQLAAQLRAQADADHTLAILVPTNQIGYKLAEHLDELDADYDNLLRGGSREREIAAAMHAILAVLADPARHQSAVVPPMPACTNWGIRPPPAPWRTWSVSTPSCAASTNRKPALPLATRRMGGALPAGVLSEDDLDHVSPVGRLFAADVCACVTLPIDDLALALGDELFAWSQDVHETDLAIAYQIATLMRRWRDTQPGMAAAGTGRRAGRTWLTGRRRLPITTPADLGYEPAAGAHHADHPAQRQGAGVGRRVPGGHRWLLDSRQSGRPFPGRTRFSGRRPHGRSWWPSCVI